MSSHYGNDVQKLREAPDVRKMPRTRFGHFSTRESDSSDDMDQFLEKPTHDPLDTKCVIFTAPLRRLRVF